jgi:hypothetical protein
MSDELPEAESDEDRKKRWEARRLRIEAAFLSFTADNHDLIKDADVNMLRIAFIGGWQANTESQVDDLQRRIDENNDLIRRLEEESEGKSE